MQDGRVFFLSNDLTVRAKARVHHAADEGAQSRPRSEAQCAKCLAHDREILACQYLPTCPVVEVTPKLLQASSQSNVPDLGSAEVPDFEEYLHKIVEFTASSRIPPGAAESKALVQFGLTGRLAHPWKPTDAQMESNFCYNYADPHEPFDVHPKSGPEDGIPEVEIHALKPCEGVGKSSLRSKRRRNDSLISPTMGSLSASKSIDAGFLPRKRQNRSNGAGDGSYSAASICTPKLSKRRSANVTNSTNDSQSSATVRKQLTQTFLSSPLRQSLAKSCKAMTGLVSIPVADSGHRDSYLGTVVGSMEPFGTPRVDVGLVTVPVEYLGIADASLLPVNITVEHAGMQNSNMVCSSVSVVGMRHPVSNLLHVRIPVESLATPNASYELSPFPVESVGVPSSRLMQVQEGKELSAQKKRIYRRPRKLTASGVKNYGKADDQSKTRGGLGFAKGGKENSSVLPSRTSGISGLNGFAGDFDTKKLPEVQKNVLRKPKRVQLKRLCLECPRLGLDTEALPEGVKSFWKSSMQMEDKEDDGFLGPVLPQRSTKPCKVTSLLHLHDTGKFKTFSERPERQRIKTIEDSDPDIKTRGSLKVDLAHLSRCRTATYTGLAQGREMEEYLRTGSRSLKARLSDEQNLNQKIACHELNAGLQKRPCGEPVLSFMNMSRRQLTENLLQKTNGHLAADNMMLDMTFQGQKRPNVQHSDEIIDRESEQSDEDSRQYPVTTEKEEVMANGVLEETYILKVNPSTTSFQLSSVERMCGEYSEIDVGFPRLTPRTRKLTDAMQDFLQQKESLLRQWKELELGKIHPMALIGRNCKVYWPLDNEWYPGVIHEFNPETRRHRIDYEDDEKEWVLLVKERVKLYLSAEEKKTLEMSFGEGSQSTHGMRLDADELAVLAASLEGCHGELNHGDIVWAKVKGYPMWPAYVMDEKHASAANLEPSPRERTVPVQFFGSYDHSRINPRKVVPFAEGIVHKYHTKCKRTVFEHGLQEIERYLKKCKLPDPMAQLQEETTCAAVKKPSGPTCNDKNHERDRELVKGVSNDVRQEALTTYCTFPLTIGTLRVVKLDTSEASWIVVESILSLYIRSNEGNIVGDSEQFHTENYIWTDGYTAIRKFTSTLDPQKTVDYKMEVLRNPAVPSLPLFRVTPENDKLVEASSASGCWKRILVRIRKAKEKAGLCSVYPVEKRQSARSGPAMFGFGDRRISKLIQDLPNARVCSKFAAWIEKPLLEEDAEELVPAGYRPVTVCWKHLDRCNICYLDEEYADNQLLQCDKCRTMVHMYCYGELEAPDGDLWLCNLCRPEAPRRSPYCCLCPVIGGAMKTTTDGRWAHLTCAMWTPETCLVDVKKMEPVDGINSICKERWKLICSVCRVPYGACIQCSKPHCRVPFHPLCARGAGLCMQVLEDTISGTPDSDGGLQLLTYCKKHSNSVAGSRNATMWSQSQQTVAVIKNHSAVNPARLLLPQRNPSGSARTEAYNAASRRGHRQPEALVAALAKRYFVENRPYIVTGCQKSLHEGNLELMQKSLLSWRWKQSKLSVPAGAEDALQQDRIYGKGLLSMSERYRHMRSTILERLTFGKSSIHGWGVFTKLSHNMGDMVIEYAGEIVRPVIADIRERRSYDSLVISTGYHLNLFPLSEQIQGAGTYMFRIDDERVVDATHAGSIAHLINHSCEPNCYSRVVTASGEDHIIIFAKRDIQEREELTYDYRFAAKDELLTCYCGCIGCRGFVNTFDEEEGPTRLIASRSELTKCILS